MLGNGTRGMGDHRLESSLKFRGGEGALVLRGGYRGKDASEIAVAGYNPFTKTLVSLSL